jgi:hypothetical protein
LRFRMTPVARTWRRCSNAAFRSRALRCDLERECLPRRRRLREQGIPRS